MHNRDIAEVQATRTLSRDSDSLFGLMLCHVVFYSLEKSIDSIACTVKLNALIYIPMILHILNLL